VWILRVKYETVEKWIKWEDAKGKTADEVGGCWDTEGKAGYFPHIHGNGLKLGRDEVESIGKWVRGDATWVAEGWPFEDDRPKGA